MKRSGIILIVICGAITFFGSMVGGCFRNAQVSATPSFSPRPAIAPDPLIALRKTASDTRPGSIYIRKSAQKLVQLEMITRSLDTLMTIARRRVRTGDEGDPNAADTATVQALIDALPSVDERYLFAGMCYDYYRLCEGPGNDGYSRIFLHAFYRCCKKMSTAPDIDSWAGLNLVIKNHDLGRHDTEDVQELIADQEKLLDPKSLETVRKFKKSQAKSPTR